MLLIQNAIPFITCLLSNLLSPSWRFVNVIGTARILSPDASTSNVDSGMNSYPLPLARDKTADAARREKTRKLVVHSWGVPAPQWYTRLAARLSNRRFMFQPRMAPPGA